MVTLSIDISIENIYNLALVGAETFATVYIKEGESKSVHFEVCSVNSHLSLLIPITYRHLKIF